MHIAAQRRTEMTAIPVLPVTIALRIDPNLTDRVAARPIATALIPKHTLNVSGEKP